jgi:beta-aspartyl-peptidase (threonine type)
MIETPNSINKYGTVGCVVLDSYGNLAAGTSTGGIVNKEYNRIGDSPLIGSGTYANNKTCAVSCTGRGEDFIKIVAAHEVSSLMEHKKISLRKATAQVLKKLTKIKGRGGLIAIDRKGKISMEFNTDGMFRGFVDTNGKVEVHIYKVDQ